MKAARHNLKIWDYAAGMFEIADVRQIEVDLGTEIIPTRIVFVSAYSLPRNCEQHQ